ncbi:hypothetical protein CHUAL_000671 [Chamberlinius hualienensis]
MTNQFVLGLRSKQEEIRAKAAQDLFYYVTTELREVPLETLTSFMDDFNHHIFEMVSSADPNDKKGGILGIVSLIGIDVGNTSTRISRFANYLRNLLPSTDTSVMELAAMAVGRVAQASGTYTAEYVEFEVKRAFEWLSGDRNEGRRHAAVLVLKELAVATPTFFFQQVHQFFDCIFNAIFDSKAVIRENSVAALQAALMVTAQRETQETQRPMWYKQCYDEAMLGFEEQAVREKGVAREDRVHGALLVLNELLKCSNNNSIEKIRQELEDVMQQQYLHEKSYKDHQPSHTRWKAPHFFSHSHSLQQLQQKGNVNPFSFSSSAKLQLYESSTCRVLLLENYDQICEQVMKHRSSRNMYVQQMLLSVLPRMAALSNQVFVKFYLNDTLTYLLSCLKRERERSSSFLAIGLLAVSVGEHIKPHLPKIMEVIKLTLPANATPSKRRAVSVDPAIFNCLSLLAKAVGLCIKSDLKDLLDYMFAVGLNPALTVALKEIAIQIPQLKKDIQDGLLKVLSNILMHRPVHSSSSSSTKHQPHQYFLHYPPSFSHLSIDAGDVASITLALKTLGNFDFQGHSLTQFVRHCAENFLSSEFKEIRMEAVRTCCRLLAMSVSSLRKSSPAIMQSVADVLGRLLIVGISDTDADIRFCVLASLDECFDEHLAQAENLSILFVSIYDEVFEIREIAICIVGRLSAKNPAYTMPTLRNTLVQILTELEHSGMGRNKEQAARMLGHLVSNAPRLIRPYMEPILKVLIPKLRDPDPNPGVVISVLAAVGEQAQVSGTEMRKWMKDMLSIVIDMLQDASSLPKREVALWTLGQLVESTGYVKEPYKEYPHLLEILLNFLKTEQSHGIRREALRVLGLLGALDPYKHKVNLGQIDHSGDTGTVISMPESDVDYLDTVQDLTTSEMLVNLCPQTLDEFYPAVAISTLMKIIRDPTLSQHHTMVVQAVTFIFKSLGIKCVPYLQQVLPSLFNVIRTSDNTFREFLFQQLGVLISIVKQHIRNYLEEIFSIVKTYWTINSPLQNTIIMLVEHIAIALGAEFKIYLQQLIPYVLKVFLHDNSVDKIVTQKLLLAINKFGSNLDEYLHVLLPPIVKLFDSFDAPMVVRKTALETVDRLTECLDFTSHASHIIHPLVRALNATPELRITAMDTLCALVVQLGRKFQIFIPMVNQVLSKHRITHQRYDVLTCRILKGSTIVDEDEEPFLAQQRRLRHRSRDRDLASASGDGSGIIKKLSLSTSNLERAWSATSRISKDDWLEWLRRFGIELLKESPSPALRSCYTLAQTYQQLQKDLFNAAFVSCWAELDSNLQEHLIEALKTALTSQDTSEITQTLLNLAEFMEHCDQGPIILEAPLLGERAMKCRAYAKALHYTEEQFHKACTLEVLEALISINNKLQQPAAAAGVLAYAIKHFGDDLVQERWYEKLHNWESALNAYRKKLEQIPDDWCLVLGEMRCLEAMGEWEQLHDLASEKWPLCDSLSDTGESIARLAAASAWGLGLWDNMEKYINGIPRESQHGAFYRAVYCLHGDKFEDAQMHIDKARDLLDSELTAMAGESYQRAYGAMVSVQMLSELEEIMRYKLVPERREAIRHMWRDRLQGCDGVVEDWQKILHVHSLVVSPHQDVKTWLKYASLCRKNGHLPLAYKTLRILMRDDDVDGRRALTVDVDPHVAFAYTKLVWKEGRKEEAFSILNEYVDKTLSSIVTKVSAADLIKKQELCHLLARCYLKLGNWKESLHGVLNEPCFPQILQYYTAATEYDPEWYKAWHAWACINFEALLYFKTQQHQQLMRNAKSSPGLSPTSAPTSAAMNSTLLSPADISTSTRLLPIAPHIHTHAVPAVQGFFRSISLSHGSSLQDTLRLLNIWFNFGHFVEVHEALASGIKSIQIDTWLQVIPQLIARIDTPRPAVGRLVHQLLMEIGKHHPQALIYPLTVASKSQIAERHTAANKILKNMCEHSNTLVQQAMMVSEELIRVAILWHELWHEGLEEASRLYFGERNVAAMLASLEPLHEMMQRGAQTLKEISFTQLYGTELNDAQSFCIKFQRSGNVKELNQAWDIYYHVFRRISKQLPQLTALALEYVSPKLLISRDLDLAVPGTYDPNQSIIRIQQVQSSINVITSKQRPRKLSIVGSNGKTYVFLLKGHEDLRQDERVMQMFGLVNTLLINDPETCRKNLTIQRYAVVPLSTNSGLIGWVPHCDTLHTLIRDYREKKKILLNIEHRIMLRIAPDYDHLTIMQKVEVFENALSNTNGDDLARLLWLKSPSSEIWFDRRTSYTNSLAVMSMVGYILGLGDRHPSNLMLDRLSGKILHIDFGDCFEVAMTREKFPEKIPFRLTRMLINAMEVTGIEGTYRLTCCCVMEAMRNNRDSLMAVLEAFVYDPLLNWRLMDNAVNKNKRSVPVSESVSSSHEHSDILDTADVVSQPGGRRGSAAMELSASQLDGDNNYPEALNKKALQIVNRVRDKLTGRDFSPNKTLEVEAQVDLLIRQATSHENLCQCYIGW